MPPTLNQEERCGLHLGALVTSQLRAGAVIGSSQVLCVLGDEGEGQTFVEACV